MEHDSVTRFGEARAYNPHLARSGYVADDLGPLQVFGAASGHEHRRPEAARRTPPPRPGPRYLRSRTPSRAGLPEAATDQIRVAIDPERVQHTSPCETAD